MVSTKALLAGTALAAISHATNIMVEVGKSGLMYSPSSFTAQIGDTVSFMFDGTHSVVQSTFEAPCTEEAGGFAVPAQQSGAVFTVNITDTNPRWFYCSVASHCQSGMVGVINPPSDHTQSDFASAAGSASSGGQPGGVSGGQLVVGSVTSGSLGAAPQTTSASSSTSASAGSTKTSSISSAASSSSSTGAAPSGAAGSLGGAAIALVAGALAIIA